MTFFLFLANSSSGNLSKLLTSSVDVEATQATTVGSKTNPNSAAPTISNQVVNEPSVPLLKPTIKTEKVNLEHLVKMKNNNNLGGLTQQTRQRFSSVDSLRSNEYYDGPPMPYAGKPTMNFGQINQMSQMTGDLVCQGVYAPPQSFGVACFGKPARLDGTTPTTYRKNDKMQNYKFLVYILNIFTFFVDRCKR